MAVNTFRGKCGYLPGDIKDPDVSSFGFKPRGLYHGEGDGNGVLEGVNADGVGYNHGPIQRAGETVMFWVDLSQADLIDGTFNTATRNIPVTSDVTGAALNEWFPQAKMGQGNYLYVYGGGVACCVSAGGGNGINYFGLSAVTDNSVSCGQCLQSNTTITPAQAFAIDTKMDDAYPQSGSVTAMYVSNTVSWAGLAPGAAAWGGTSTNPNGNGTC
jgi:hypothetical protein